MWPRKRCPANGYDRARRRVSTRRQSREAENQCSNASNSEQQMVLNASVAGQWSGLGGPYLQQVMPGIHMGLSWRQMFWSLTVIVIATGGLAYLAISYWLGAVEVFISYADCSGNRTENGTVNGTSKPCEITFELPKKLDGPVYVYYRLCSVYMNHRYMQTSWSMPQLMGTPTTKLNQSCKKFAYRDDKLVMPCGALPNSIFNDTISITGPWNSGSNSTAAILALASNNLSWPSHRAVIHQALSAKLFENTVKPENWPEPVEKRYSRPFADAEDLWMWLITPAFSCFRKIVHRVELNDSLPAGSYRAVISDNYPVAEFGGTKSFILAEKTPLGGKNLALAVLLIVDSATYFLLSLCTIVECYCRLRRRALALGIVID